MSLNTARMKMPKPWGARDTEIAGAVLCKEFPFKIRLEPGDVDSSPKSEVLSLRAKPTRWCTL